MKRFIWILTLILTSSAITLAQDSCPLLEIALQEALVTCENLENDSLCYGSGNLSIDTLAEEFSFDAEGDSVSLSELISLESVNDTDNLATAIMRLNREDADIRLIAYGNIEIENTAPTNIISVYALRGVNLRQSPSVEATVVGSLVQRQNYIAIGRLADNSWLQIRLDDGRVGWASAQYFSTTEGFAELDAVTPSSLAFLPMQSLSMTTEDCGGLLIIAPEIEDEIVVFAINGAQIQVTGIIHLSIEDDFLIITAITGDALVDSFGFETALTENEWTSIQLGTNNTIINIASDPETNDESILTDDLMEILLGEE